MSIGLADSLNPSTIGPALYLAAGEHPRQTVTKFTLGVFVVYLAGGVLIAVGPGELLIDLVARPSHVVRHVIEVGVGVAMVSVGVLLWRHRRTLVHLDPPAPNPHGRSSALLGAGITAVELPTAFPYFAAIAAIVGSGMGLPQQVFLLVVFNVCFVLPLLAIIMTLSIWGDEAAVKLARARELLQRYWPALLATVAVLAGVFVITIGVTGLAATVHGRLGRFFKGVHGSIPH